MGYKQLIKSFEFAENFRFSYDIATEAYNLDQEVLKNIESDRSHSSLLISEKVTPKIYSILSETCNKLKLDMENVSACIYSSPDNQAACFLGDKDRCTIMIASGLIDLMNESELQFVIGHEIGHFLLKHGTVTHNSKMSKEDLIFSRYKEISADRIGLVASDSINSALSSIMKMLSGLDSQHLRFDIKALMKQIEDHSMDSFLSSEHTHPSWLIRIRALQWFEMSDIYKEFISDNRSKIGDPIERIDELIFKELDEFIDKPIQEEIENLKQNLSFWLHIFAVLDDEQFDKKEQQIIEQEFGEKKLLRVKEILSSKNKVESRKFVNQLLIEKIDSFQDIAPKEFSHFYVSETKVIEEKLKVKNLSLKIQNYNSS